MLSLPTKQALWRRGSSTAKCIGVTCVAGYTLFKLAASKLNEYIEAYQVETASNELYAPQIRARPLTCPAG